MPTPIWESRELTDFRSRASMGPGPGEKPGWPGAWGQRKAGWCLCAADSPVGSLGWTVDWGPCRVRAEALGEDAERGLYRVERARWGHGSGSRGEKVGSGQKEVSLTPDLKTTFSKITAWTQFLLEEKKSHPPAQNSS